MVRFGTDVTVFLPVGYSSAPRMKVSVVQYSKDTVTRHRYHPLRRPVRVHLQPSGARLGVWPLIGAVAPQLIMPLRFLTPHESWYCSSAVPKPKQLSEPVARNDITLVIRFEKYQCARSAAWAAWNPAVPIPILRYGVCTPEV